jgi:RNA polymerase sigma-70 factor (ECF subfamily)
LDPSATPQSARLAPADERALVERYVGAWERGDVQAFAALLAEDVVLSMPPLSEWYVGPAATADFFRFVTGPDGGGPFRLVPTRANASVAFGVYGSGPSGPGSTAFLLSVLLAGTHGITAITSFMNPGLFPAFDLPPILPASPATHAQP